MTHIDLTHVCVDLPIYDANSRSMKNKLFGIGRRNGISGENNGVIIVRALRDITLRLDAGDRVGLIGSNGAGKSTLLRVLAGIYSPTLGSISQVGRSVALLDISHGMDDNSSGHQNIRLRGLLLGMSDAEIRSKEEEIARFTQLGDHLNLPVRTYSSGMRVRLAFAISTAVDADILLLDEVMGVGDASFTAQTNVRIEDLKNRAKIVVLALHANATLRASCNKGLWLEKGEIQMFGPIDDVIDAYETFSKPPTH